MTKKNKESKFQLAQNNKAKTKAKNSEKLLEALAMPNLPTKLEAVKRISS